MAIVTRNGSIVREVKNLGWLLRRAYGFNRPDGLALSGTFGVAETRDGRAILLATMKDGLVFQTTFESRTVLRYWLDRPSFQGYPIKWTGRDGQTRAYCDIGSESWKAFDPTS